MNYNEFVQQAVIASLPQIWQVTIESPTIDDMLDAATSAADLLVKKGLLDPALSTAKISRGLPVIDFVEDEPGATGSIDNWSQKERYRFVQNWEENDRRTEWKSLGWVDIRNNPVEIEGFEMEAIEVRDQGGRIWQATFIKKP